MKKLLTTLILAGCTMTPQKPEVPTPTPDPVVIVDPPVIVDPVPETPKPRPQVNVGWLPEYEAFIKETVVQFPFLLEIPQSEMQSFCPGWSKMNKDQRVQFYVDLLYSMTGPESSYNRFSWMVEDMGVDPVTGFNVRSEGLLQLSYQDTRNYKSWLKGKGKDISVVDKFCPFDFAKDKPQFLIDQKSGKAGPPGRTINDAYNNLSCSVFITNLLVTGLRPISSDKYDFREAMGGYWAVMRYTGRNVKGHARVRTALVKRQPTCNVVSY